MPPRGHQSQSLFVGKCIYRLTLQGGHGHNQLENIKIELTSENDLFFHYRMVITEDSFRQMQEEQRLMIHFAKFSEIFMKMINSCIKEPHR